MSAIITPRTRQTATPAAEPPTLCFTFAPAAPIAGGDQRVDQGLADRAPVDGHCPSCELRAYLAAG